MKQIVEENEDFAFYIKMLPLKTHPAAYRKSKAIVCERSVRLLERALDGKRIPDPSCETTEVDDTIELAERLGITGTPTIVLPDGGIIPGYKEAEELKKLVEEAGLAVEERERQAMEAEEAASEETPVEGVIEEGADSGREQTGVEVPEMIEEEAPGAGEEPPEEPAEKPKRKKRWWW